MEAAFEKRLRANTRRYLEESAKGCEPEEVTEESVDEALESLADALFKIIHDDEKHRPNYWFGPSYEVEKVVKGKFINYEASFWEEFFPS